TGRRTRTPTAPSSSTWRSSTTGSDGIPCSGTSVPLLSNVNTSRSERPNLSVYGTGASPESPNAYLAWTQLPKLAQRYGFTVDPVPILYAALLDAHGQLGPGECPAKGRWMSKNLARKAVLLGVPLNPPAFLPFNPLLALRTTLLPSNTRER